MTDVLLRTPRWEVVGASVRGAAHERDGRPNQDAFAALPLPDGGVAVAVADGHGGKRYVRSAAGSRIAVEVASRLAVQVFARRHSHRELDLRALAAAIVDEWRTRVLRDLDENPFEPGESIDGVDLSGSPLVAYGATCLLAVVCAHGATLLQLGDGDIVVLDGTAVSTPVPGDGRLVGGVTTSLCTGTAAADTRCAVLADRDVSLVLLATDGYSNSFADDDWSDQVLPDIARRIRADGASAVATDLPGWIAESASVGGDDTTVVVLARVLRVERRRFLRRRTTP
ncbi:PP2C family serine/threonine-protein phosphatase [Cellulomonas sp. URHD0024]|uniref:PP2C family serine/threonine-protein phosphatase n=1 Tax=Cellulomonas sp. URHD0024 TaxID=1302620 RepID=UPI00040D80DE|nr:PP2C family serine/threonine-protein phosphatase [Cellulomonas sp. URHD0024]